MKNKLLFFSTVTALISIASAYGDQCNSNVVDYWGQNSYGAANPSDVANYQQQIDFYCNDDSVQVLPISFLTTFFGVGGKPEINLANYCSSDSNATFTGTNLANCQKIASGINFCQSKGKLITLSMGGATGGVGFESDAQAAAFADTIWNLFLGGSSTIRPFGSAILDGIDLDIEGGGSSHYLAFLTKLKSYFSSSSKKYYVTAAPQCVYPDSNLQTTLDGFPFDAIYVQFYNNPCALTQYDTVTAWNFGVWDFWARTISPNPNIKVFIGAPASSSAANGGFVDVATLTKIALATQKSFPSFGGVMFWDASQAHKNNRIDLALRNALTANENCDGTITLPACTAPAFTTGKDYPAGSTVTYNYTWTAKWYASNTPSADASSEWTPTSACGSSGTESHGGASTSTATKTFTVTTVITSTVKGHTKEPTSTNVIATTTTTTTTFTSTITHHAKISTTTNTKLGTDVTTTTDANSATTTGSGSGSGSCTGVAAWNSNTAYVGGSTVTYGGSLWKSSYWTQASTPGGSGQEWVKISACSSKKRSKRSLVQKKDKSNVYNSAYKLQKK